MKINIISPMGKVIEEKQVEKDILNLFSNISVSSLREAEVVIEDYYGQVHNTEAKIKFEVHTTMDFLSLIKRISHHVCDFTLDRNGIYCRINGLHDKMRTFGILTMNIKVDYRLIALTNCSVNNEKEIDNDAFEISCKSIEFKNNPTRAVKLLDLVGKHFLKDKRR